jgi:hypothetical protein
MTVYSALYKTIKNDIDNSTILMLRGAIQVIGLLKNIFKCKLNILGIHRFYHLNLYLAMLSCIY